MLKALLDFLLNRKGHPVQTDTAVAAPYKVEIPGAVNAIAEPAKCGCGRSPTGNCVGYHKLTDTEWAAHADNKKPDSNWPFPQAAAPAETKEMKPAVKAKSVRAKKVPAAAITAAEKPAAKKPAKPRAKKAPKA